MTMSLPIGASKDFARPPAKVTQNPPWAERLYWTYLYFEVNYIPCPNTRILVYFFHCAIWDQVIPKMWLTDFGLIKNPPHNPCSRSWIPTYNAAITVTWARRMIPGWWNRVRLQDLPLKTHQIPLGMKGCIGHTFTLRSIISPVPIPESWCTFFPVRFGIRLSQNVTDGFWTYQKSTP